MPVTIQVLNAQDGWITLIKSRWQCRPYEIHAKGGRIFLTGIQARNVCLSSMVLGEMARNICRNINTSFRFICQNCTGRQPNAQKCIRQRCQSRYARLKGARVVNAAEPQKNSRLNESLIKQLTGGDMVTARFLYGKEFEYRPSLSFGLIQITNPRYPAMTRYLEQS